MAAFVQGTGAYTTGTAASISKAYDDNVGSNADLVVGACERNGSWSITFSDSEANGYTVDESEDSTLSSGVGHSFNVGAAALTVTATPGTSDYLSIGILEFSGLSAYDVSNIVYGVNVTSVQASFTTNEADVCVSIGHNEYNCGAWTSGPGGYTLVYEADSGPNSHGVSVYYKIQGASGAETPQVDWTNSGRGCIAGAGYTQAAAPSAAITVLSSAYYERIRRVSGD